MATFNEHISQAKKNLSFLEKINSECNDYWDWQVTTCFYVAVHLANAHISEKSNLHYRTHVDVKHALNPEIQLSITKFSDENYTAYVKLMNLSRRARYLCHDNTNNKNAENAYFTHSIHLKKALKNLDKLITFMSNEYHIKFEMVSIDCVDMRSDNLANNFSIKR